MRLAGLANQYVSEQEPWAALKADPDRAGTILYVALRAVDSLKILLAPYLPTSSQQLHELLGYDGWLVGPAPLRDRGRGTREPRRAHRRLRATRSAAGRRASCRPASSSVSRNPVRQARRGEASSPTSSRGWRRPPRRDGQPRAPRRVRRTGVHARRPRSRGGRRARRHDRHGDRFVPPSACDRRRGARRRRCTRHRPASGGLGRGRSCRRAARAAGTSRRPWPSARRGSTGSTTLPRSANSGPCWTFSSRSPRSSSLPVVIHSRDADDGDAAALEPFDRHGDPALLLGARRCSTSRSRRRYYVSFAGNVTYPKATDAPAAAAARFRSIGSWPRPTVRISRRSRSRQSRNEPAHVVHTLRGARRRAGRRRAAQLEAAIDANARAAFALP